MYVCTYVRMYVCTYVRTYVCTYVRTYVCMYVCMYVGVCIYTQKYIYMYTPMWSKYTAYAHACLCISTCQIQVRRVLHQHISSIAGRLQRDGGPICEWRHHQRPLQHPSLPEAGRSSSLYGPARCFGQAELRLPMFPKFRTSSTDPRILQYEDSRI